MTAIFDPTGNVIQIHLTKKEAGDLMDNLYAALDREPQEGRVRVFLMPDEEAETPNV